MALGGHRAWGRQQKGGQVRVGGRASGVATARSSLATYASRGHKAPSAWQSAHSSAGTPQ